MECEMAAVTGVQSVVVKVVKRVDPRVAILADPRVA